MTLAHSLVRAVRCSSFCRDEIKEGFINTTGQAGTPGDDVGWRVYDLFFDTLQLLLSRRVTLVAEAAFQHKLWAPKLVPLGEIARIRVVLCAVDPERARSRHAERGRADPARQRFHPDRAVQGSLEGQAGRAGHELPIEEYDPPHLDVPTLTVDTSNGYQPPFETIVAFARG